jgi:ABC-type multidrug transport system fused ATPase/permease subunit
MQSVWAVRATRFGIVVAVFAIWEILSRTGIVNPRLLPSASDTLVTLGDLLQRASVRKDLVVTATEVVTAFALAVPVGALIGFLIAENKYFSDVAKPLLFFAFSIPKSIFLPMFILVFGVGYAEKVGFGFAEASERILDDVSVSVEPGQIVGITGKSGSGKSTLLRLLMRFWDVSEGSVELSGTDVREVQTSALRNAEALVEQETSLFHDSIRDNLLIAKPDATIRQYRMTILCLPCMSDIV